MIQAGFLTGWGQGLELPVDCLPDGKVLHCISYLDFDNYHKFISDFKFNISKDSILIGWSLGGALACHLVEEGAVAPKLLVLLGTPIQFVSDAQYHDGMNGLAFQAFSTLFHSFPSKAISQLVALSAKGDSMAGVVRQSMASRAPQGAAHLDYWLDFLAKDSLLASNFDGFPRTLIVHGRADHVVSSRQAEALSDRIPNNRLSIWDDCGHAPHLHDAKRLAVMIKEEWQML